MRHRRDRDSVGFTTSVLQHSMKKEALQLLRTCVLTYNGFGGRVLTRRQRRRDGIRQAGRRRASLSFSARRAFLVSFAVPVVPDPPRRPLSPLRGMARSPARRYGTIGSITARSLPSSPSVISRRFRKA